MMFGVFCGKFIAANKKKIVLNDEDDSLLECSDVYAVSSGRLSL
jgi:hypothetical protein